MALHFSPEELAGRRATSGVMVTGSHNPPDYNGFKMVLAGQAIYGEQIQALRQRIEQGDFSEGAGSYVQVDDAECRGWEGRRVFVDDRNVPRDLD